MVSRGHIADIDHLDPSNLNIVISTFKNMFACKRILKRAHLFTCELLNLSPTDESPSDHPLYRGQLKMCYRALLNEYSYIRSHIRLLQKKPNPLSTKRRRRTPHLSAYTLFCQNLHKQHKHEEISGKIQELWKQHKQQLAWEARGGSIAEKRPVDPLPIQSHPKTYDDDDDTDSDTSDDSEPETTSNLVKNANPLVS